MNWRLLALLCAARAVAGCGNDHAAETLLHERQHAASVHAMHVDFPFPVMSDWTERSRLQPHGLPRQDVASIWIHEGDPVAHATSYRHALEAAGYLVEPGRLSGNAQVAFTGSGSIAGKPYRFTIDFAREGDGDQRVALVFTPHCATR